MSLRSLFTAFLAACTLAITPCDGATHNTVASAANLAWPFQHSDIAPDPAFHFGRLSNGLRYVLRHNATPKGEVIVRMQVNTGSLDEHNDERGYAHFVEHMAFLGSTHVAQGEMVRLLEHNGLAFGADTNAFTTYETTTYHLDLPTNKPELIDTALMLMRETASELSFVPAAVDHERGVIFAEKRDRNSWQYREVMDRYAFTDPQALYTSRAPIGTDQSLNTAGPEALRAFWRRNYVPGRTTLIVIGDIDLPSVEKAIHAHFDDWPVGSIVAQPSAGPVHAEAAPSASIYLDPSLSEHITASRRRAWRDEQDTLAHRHENLLRAIGYGIVNRRLIHLARQADAPFRGARFGSSDIFHAARETALNVDSVDGRWRRALIAAAMEVRRTLEQGVSTAEIVEQFANIRGIVEGNAERSETQSNAALTQQILNMIRNDHIPSSPIADREWLRAQQSGISPETVLAALKRDAAPLGQPLLRFVGRKAPEGGAEALRTAWDEAMSANLPKGIDNPPTPFSYTDFGPAGHVQRDYLEPALGIREVVFANGVRLNVKHTDIVSHGVLVHLSIDGGQMLATKDNPLAVEMTSMMGTGGLGKHSLDDLQTLTAGRGITLGLGVAGDTFFASAAPRRADLLLQLQMMTALITAPGYRPEGEVIFRQNANTMFLRLRTTPGAALGSAIGGILSDNDPRFTLQPAAAYRALSFSRLARDIGDRLNHGAIEIGIVGDVDENTVIADVARTFGALPTREPDFRPYTAQRQRSFTQDHSLRRLTHTGPKDQALVQYVWATRDDTDPQAKQVLNMLQRIVHLQLTENLRQRLGRAYSPSASSDPSRIWRDYGTFSIAASVDVDSVPITRKVIENTVGALRDAPPSEDLMQRAREPLLETLNNALKTNAGWLGLVARAQTQPDQIERHIRARERLLAVTPQQVQALASRYLKLADAVPMVVLPDASAADQAAQNQPNKPTSDTENAGN